MYQALYIDPEIEIDYPDNQNDHNQQSRLRRILRWIHKNIFKVHLYKMPYGRRSLVAHLQSRKTEPRFEWDSSSVPYEIARPILHAIARELNLPNANFIPSDLIILAIITDYENFPTLGIHRALEVTLGHVIDHDEMCEMMDKDGATMESFVNYLIQRK